MDKLIITPEPQVALRALKVDSLDTIRSLANVDPTLTIFVLKRSTEALKHGCPTVGTILSTYPDLLSYMRGHTLVWDKDSNKEYEAMCIQDPTGALASFARGFIRDGKFTVWEAFKIEDVNESGEDGTTNRKELIDSIMEKVKNVK